MYGNAVKYHFYSSSTGQHLGDRIYVTDIDVSTHHDGMLNIVDEQDLLWDENKPLPNNVLNPFAPEGSELETKAVIVT